MPQGCVELREAAALHTRRPPKRRRPVTAGAGALAASPMRAVCVSQQPQARAVPHLQEQRPRPRFRQAEGQGSAGTESVCGEGREQEGGAQDSEPLALTDSSGLGCCGLCFP